MEKWEKKADWNKKKKPTALKKTKTTRVYFSIVPSFLKNENRTRTLFPAGFL